MKASTLTSLLFAALTMCCPAVVTADTVAPATQPNATTPQTASDSKLLQDPQLVTGQLDNGLKYFIRPCAEPKGRMSVRLRVATGSLNETEDTQGLAHFLEHMVFNGSDHFKRGEMMQSMQRQGLGIGGDANAYTSFDETVYMMDLPNLEEKTVDLAMTIMEDFAAGAHLDQSAIESERGIITSELKLRDSAKFRMFRESMNFVLDGTMIGQRMPIGKLSFIQNGNRDMFVNYYTTQYNPARMQLILVGDITPEQGKAWVEKYFGGIAKRDYTFQPNWGTLTPYKGVSAKWFSNPDATDQEVSIIFARNLEKRPQTVATRISELRDLVAVLAVNKRLDEMTKQVDCPFIGAGIDREDLFNMADVFTASANTAPDKWKESLAALEQEVRRAIQFGFSKDEIQDIISDLVTNAKTSIESWPTVKGPNLSDGIAKAIADNRVFTAPEEDARVLNEAIKSGAITPESCQKALADMVQLDNVKLASMGKDPNEAGEKELIETYLNSSKTPVAPRAEVKRAPFAYDNVGEAGKVVAKTVLSDTGVTQLTLSNNVKVNIKPTQFDKGTIVVRAEVDGGLVTIPDNKPALPFVSNFIVNGGGLEAHSNDDLARLLAGRMVGTGFSIDDERFVISGGTTPADLELELKLVAAQLLHSGFRPEAEVQFLRSLPSQFASMKKDPDKVLKQQGFNFLYGGDTRFSIPELEDVQKITTADVRDWVNPALNSAYLELTLVGDLDVDAVIPVLEKTIGALPERAKAPQALNPDKIKVNMAPAGSSKTITYPSEIDRTNVCTIWLTKDGTDAKYARRLELVADILQESLFTGIREKMGEAYSPFVIPRASRTYPGVGFLMSVAPGVVRNREMVEKAVLDITLGIGKGTIDQDQLDRAKKPLVSKLLRKQRENGYWTSVLSSSQAKPDDIKRATEAIDDIQSITLDEINAFVRDIFVPGKSIQLDVLPDLPDQGGTKPDAQQPASTQAAVSTAAFFVNATAVSRTANYVVLIPSSVAKDKDWMAVAQALQVKHNATVLSYKQSPNEVLDQLRKLSPRFLALVAPPTLVDRVLVNQLHRLTRKIDDDPYGDCIWGIITGYSPADALRIAKSGSGIIIQRAEGTTNIDASRFSDSMCITDWGPFEYVEQHGYSEAKVTPYPKSDKGIVPKFAEWWEQYKPELIVSSSHATQFNLEMPFEKGLIVSHNNRFHVLDMNQRQQFTSFLRGVLFNSDEKELAQFLTDIKAPTIAPDNTPKVWLASGNCLLGDVKKTNNSMAVTALSAYGCNQFAGYTVPSWYGNAGWGTLRLFFGNHDKSSLAEAWYLNNQLLLEETVRRFPNLMKVEFNSEEISTALQNDRPFIEGIQQAGYGVGKDQIGLIHDRDTFAFYGDPAWIARLDESNTQSPWKLTWKSADNPTAGITIKATKDHTGPLAIWFPKRIKATQANVTINGKAEPIQNIGLLTNDFILIRELKLDEGETATISFKS
jgi:zinc protease